MYFRIHGALWLTCVLLPGDLCAQDTPSDQGVSLPVSIPEEASGQNDLLSSTNQGNNASRNGRGLFRGATTIERAALISVIDLEAGHRHQAVFKVNAPQAVELRFELPEAAREVEASAYGMKLLLKMSGAELRVALTPLSLTRVQINYVSESMQAPSVLDEVPVLASTRQIYGSEDVGVDSELATFIGSLTRPWTSTADVMLMMDEDLDWEIVSHREPESEPLRKVVMPRDAVASVVDSHALAERWNVRPADAVRELRERLTVTGKVDGMAVWFELKRGRHLVHAIARAYQNHRIALAENMRNRALGLAPQQLKEQKERTEAARQRMLEMAERYEIDAMPVTLELENAQETVSETEDGSLASARDEIQKLEHTLEALEGMGRNSMDRVVDETTQSALAPFLPDYQKRVLAKQRLIDRGLGVGHPEVREAERHVVEAQRSLESAFDQRKKDVRERLTKMRLDLELREARSKDARTELLSDHQPKKPIVPREFLPMYTQAQTGAWPEFDYVIEDLAGKTRRAWLKVGACILVVVVGIGLFKRGLLTWRYSNSKARLQS